MEAKEDPPAPEHLARYRPNVGMVLISPAGLVWLGRRAETEGPHNWQFPQGGVDRGERLHEAALRELAEETGARSVNYLARTREWVAYDFPPNYRRGKRGDAWLGQRQIWFAFRFTGSDAEFDLDQHHHAEFADWKWASAQEALDLVVPFKRATYAHVIDSFRPFLAAEGSRSSTSLAGAGRD